MPTKEELKQQVGAVIDQRADYLINIGETILRHPELGFKEQRTAALVAKTLGELGVPHVAGLALTGVKGELQGRQPGPSLAIMGELDALVVPGHALADTETGAAHACGHHVQITGMLGATMALVATNAMQHLAGRVVPFAVPAEEYGEIAWRLDEVRAGRLEFLGGKPELIRLGHLDDVDMAMLVHTTSRPEDKRAGVAVSNNGCVVKTAHFLGRAAHAGSAPHLGVNALYAAHVALSAINALRETFQERDTIRVHPIITKGGEQVNVIPSDVHLETYVRGKTIEAILTASAKIDRALRAGALALGARVEITTLPGYMPLVNNGALSKVFQQAAEALVGADNYTAIGHRTGSTDMGDISQIMPAVQGYVGGATGTGHGADYEITDPRLAYLGTAKILAMSAIELLWDDARVARAIQQGFTPPMSRSEYLAVQRRINCVETFDGTT